MGGKKEKANDSRSRHPLVWSMRLCFWAFLLIVCSVAGVSVGTVLGYLSAQASIPELEYYDPPEITRVMTPDGKRMIAEFFSEKRMVLALRYMPPALLDAFVAIEDERFYDHMGVDPQGILRAMWANTRKRKLRQGGSTITQQMTRNVLASIGTSRTYGRKMTEAFVALQIESRYSKDQILAFYLNQIFLGHNSYGVRAAAETYFGKDLMDLNVAECASLASIPQSPSRVNPITNPERLIARRNQVLARMAELKMIDEKTAKEEQERPLPPPVAKQRRRSSPYFVDHVERYIQAAPDLSEEVLSVGGYQIISSINTDYQKVLEEEIVAGLKSSEEKWIEAKPRLLADMESKLMEKHGSLRPRKGQVRMARITEVRMDGIDVGLSGYKGSLNFRKEMVEDKKSGKKVWTGGYKHPYFNPAAVLKKDGLIEVIVREVDAEERSLKLSWYDNKHILGAAVLLDASTGNILALVGGANFYDQDNGGMWNNATRTGRQPGSSFKPLLYAKALEKEGGRTLGSIFIDEKIEFGDYVPRNYGGYYKGPMTLFRALVTSNNVVTIKLFQEMGIRTMLKEYAEFDIVGDGEDWDLDEAKGLPLCLGSLSTTPLSMAAAYLPFVRHGVAIEPLSVVRIDDLNGNTVKRFKPRERLVLSPQAAYLVTAALHEAVQSKPGNTGAFVANYFSEFSFPTPHLAGKTGTTSDCVDSWFVGYSPDLVLAVWVGFDRGMRPMGPKMTGSKVAGPIWCEMMRRVLESRTDWKMAFDVPPDIVFRDISAYTGLLPSDEEYRTGAQIFPKIPFIKGTEPTVRSDGQSAGYQSTITKDASKRALLELSDPVSP